jgi:bifunctional DNA-binding transcriptional regulator/antitoxin component of YhaV-PrlF toxin-antitoxin module
MAMGSGVSTVAAKWRVTIPGEIRKALDVQVGDRLAWEVKDGVLMARRLPRLSSLAGILGGASGFDECGRWQGCDGRSGNPEARAYCRCKPTAVLVLDANVVVQFPVQDVRAQAKRRSGW